MIKYQDKSRSSWGLGEGDPTLSATSASKEGKKAAYVCASMFNARYVMQILIYYKVLYIYIYIFYIFVHINVDIYIYIYIYIYILSNPWNA